MSLSCKGGVQTFTVPAGHMSATFDITLVDDSLDEPDETILIEWDLSISSSAMPAFFDFTGTIADNDSTAAVTPPALVSATVSGTALTLTYDKNLDEGAVPAAGAYAVDVDGTTTTVSSVAVAGIEATLTLASAATSTATTTVDYVVPARIRSAVRPRSTRPLSRASPVAHIVDLVRNRSQAAAGVTAWWEPCPASACTRLRRSSTRGETRPAIYSIPSSSTLGQSRRTPTR